MFFNISVLTKIKDIHNFTVSDRSYLTLANFAFKCFQFLTNDLDLTYLLCDLKILRKENSEEATFLRDNFRWYIVPNVNPDGYVYTWLKVISVFNIHFVYF